MNLGERGRLLRHRPDEDGDEEEWQGQEKRRYHYEHHHRSYGGLPAELDVVDEEEDSSSSWRKNSPASITHFARVALIAGVLLASAAMVASIVVRPPLPLRRGTIGSSDDSSSGSSSSPIGMAAEEVHGAGRGAGRQQDYGLLREVDGADVEKDSSSPDGMSDSPFRTKNNINPEAQVGEQGDDATRSSSSSNDKGKISTKRSGSSSASGKRKSSSSRDSTRSSSRGSGSAGGTQGEEEQEEQQPNVIFILIDDVGMNDIGNRSTDLQELAPFMDSLSSEGVRLTKYYTNHLCTPSRVSFKVEVGVGDGRPIHS